MTKDEFTQQVALALINNYGNKPVIPSPQVIVEETKRIVDELYKYINQ